MLFIGITPNKQIILSADCHPSQIATLSERLKTRFEGGLMAQVISPDIETKIAIIQRKAEERKYILDFQVAQSGISTLKRSFLSFQFLLRQKNDKNILKLKDIKQKEDIKLISSFCLQLPYFNLKYLCSLLLFLLLKFLHLP